jgi:hypothetical protein
VEMLGFATIYLLNKKLQFGVVIPGSFHTGCLSVSWGFGLRNVFFFGVTRFTPSSFWGGVMLQDDLYHSLKSHLSDCYYLNSYLSDCY